MDKKIDKPEAIKVTCDAHGWMHGWWIATDTPYFAVTDDKGNYTIKDVPPGDYTVEVWQEKLGTADEKADVKDGGPRDRQLLDEAEGLVEATIPGSQQASDILRRLFFSGAHSRSCHPDASAIRCMSS